jgi:hypothetical protein
MLKRKGAFSFLHANQLPTPMPGSDTVEGWQAKLDSQAEELKLSLNTLMDELEKTTATSGAEQIGSAAITGVTGTTIQAKLSALKALIDALPLDNTISTAKLVDLAVTTAKLADLAVTSAKLGASAVTETKIADSAVTTAKIAAGALDGRYFTETELGASTGTTGAQLIGANVTGLTGVTIHAVLETIKTSLGALEAQLPDGQDIPYTMTRIDDIEAQFTKDQIQSSIIQRALSIIETDQSTPLWMVKLLGLTRVNLLGKDGNCESLSPFTTAGIAPVLSTTQKKSGSNSIKVTPSDVSASYVWKDYSYKLDTTKQYILSAWAYIESWTSGTGLTINVYDKGAFGTPRYTSPLDTSVIGSWQLVYVKIPTSNTISTEGFRLLVGSANTGVSVAYFDSIRIYELSATDSDAIGTTYTTDTQIDAFIPYVDSMQPTLNPWIKSFGKNLLPPFSQWTLHANATVVSDYELELVATGTYQATSYIQRVVAGQSYTLKCSYTGTDPQVFARTRTSSGTTIANYFIPSSGGSVTFTAESNAVDVEIVMRNQTSTSGTFAFTNPSLVLGSIALDPWQPQNTDVAVIEGQFRGNPITGVYDSVTERDGHYWWNKRHEFKLLTGSDAWALLTDATGYKQVYIANTLGVPYSSVVSKYDGKILTNRNNVTIIDGADQSYLTSTNQMRISVADTDTGWFDAWTGTEITADWMDAYFNGWKYTGTADKLTLSWVSVYDGASAPTQTLAYVSANRASGMTDENAYQLEYQLADSQEIDLGVVNGVSVGNGETQAEFGEGMIPEELASPIKNSVGTLYHINIKDGTAGMVSNGAQLSIRSDKIVKIYKKDKDDTSNWTIVNDSNAYGNSRAYIDIALFDTTAQYTVTYLPLDKYLMTSNVIEVEVGYATNLKSVVQRNTQDIADGKNNVKDIEGDIERRLLKGEGEKVQKGTLAHTLVAAGSWSTANITFPIAYADVTTIDIDVTVSVGATRYRTYEPLISNLTTTGFTLNFHQIEASGGAVTIRWKSTGK